MPRPSGSNLDQGADPPRSSLRLYAAIALSVSLVWCLVYGKTSVAAWQTPISYTGDSWFFLSFARAFQNGQVHLAWPKTVTTLGAPGVAHWNDWPFTEELPLALMGWLARLTGLMEASNLITLGLFVLAGLTFGMAARNMGYHRGFVYAGAVLFGTCPVLWFRSLQHLNVACCFPVPLMLLMARWCSLGTLTRKQLLAAAAISFLSGCLNPYYTFMYLQFLGFACLGWVLRRRWREAAVPVLLVACTGAGFVLMNADTFAYRVAHGSNVDAVVRDLRGLEIFGLRLPDLATPPAFHPLYGWMNNHYLSRLEIGEGSAAYIGVVGLLTLAALGA